MLSIKRLPKIIIDKRTTSGQGKIKPALNNRRAAL